MPTNHPIQTLLDRLETSLSELERIGRENRAALVGLDGEGLRQATERQAQVVESLARLSAAHRSAAGDEARGSLVARIAALDAPSRTPLLERLARLRDRAGRIKLQIAADWLLTWRLDRYVRERLAILAQATGSIGGRPGQGLVIDSTA